MDIVMALRHGAQLLDLFSIVLSESKAGRNEKRKWCLGNEKKPVVRPAQHKRKHHP